MLIFFLHQSELIEAEFAAFTVGIKRRKLFVDLTVLFDDSQFEVIHR
jgi:hypothetical protein